MFTRKLERVGAIVLLAGCVGLIGAFGYLGVVFDYPAILDRGAAEVLPRLHGGALHAVWIGYAMLPLTVLVAGVAAMPLLEDGGGRGLARLGVTAAALAALFMIVGLARWPSLHWVLAERWPAATPDQREIYGALFDASNRYLGNFLGELLGETALAAWFACIGLALRRAERRIAGTLSLVAAAVVVGGALRVLTPAVAPVAAVANLVLPGWLVAIAAILWRRPACMKLQ